MTGAATGVPSLAEDIQLMLQVQQGRLEPDRVMPGAAALIELALLGRIGTARGGGLLSTPADDSRLVVVDSAPTGSSLLDDALAVLVAKRKPAFSLKVLQSVNDAVVPHVFTELVRRGVVRDTGGYPSGADGLPIADEARLDERKSVLARARTLPSTVTDPRLGAIVDLLRSNGRYRGDAGELDLIAGDWYPVGAKDAVASILRGVRRLCESQ